MIMMMNETSPCADSVPSAMHKSQSTPTTVSSQVSPQNFLNEEAIEILEGSEGHNEEISKIWNYV